MWYDCCSALIGFKLTVQEIWDRQKLVKINSYQEDLAVFCEFTPDGTHTLVGTLSPRLRVDNRFRIRSYKGDIVWQEDFKELFTIAIQPVSSAKDTATLEEKTDFQPIVKPQTETKKSSYVPPHLRNGARSSGGGIVGMSSTPPNGKKVPKNGPASGNKSLPPDNLSPKERNIKALERKIRQIQQLKDKQAAGEELEKNQLDKISSETELIKQLEQLRVT